MAYRRLGELLVSDGLVSEEQVKSALERQIITGNRIGEALVEMGAINEEQLIQALGGQLGIQAVNLIRYPPAPGSDSLVPVETARKYNLVPLGCRGDVLYIAMSDPLNFYGIEEVKAQVQKRVVIMIATQSDIEKCLIKLYGNTDATQALKEIMVDAASEESVLDAVDITTDDPSAAPTVRLVNSILERAVVERASDIHCEPREQEMVVRLRVDGVLHPVFHIPGNAMNSVVSRLKIMGNMDIAERKTPQDGRCNIRAKGRDVDLRISTLPTIYGEKMVIRLLDKAAANLGREGIGLSGVSLNRYETLLRNSSGVILISGPTGSGKSSTMYTMIQDLNTDEVNMVTLENPVEFNTEGVNQCQINEKTGMTFANGLRSILRQDPDIIVVGEVRDGETASIAMRAAITGHLVLSTIHTNDSISTVDRLIDMGVEPFLISTALKGVIAQRLVRRICPRCKTAYPATEEECQLLGIPYEPELKFYHGKGCNECFKSGYRGRAAVFEILVVDNYMRKLVTSKANREEYVKHLQGSTFLSLADYSRDMVMRGITTPQEAARTIYSSAAEA